MKNNSAFLTTSSCHSSACKVFEKKKATKHHEYQVEDDTTFFFFLLCRQTSRNAVLLSQFTNAKMDTRRIVENKYYFQIIYCPYDILYVNVNFKDHYIPKQVTLKYGASYTFENTLYIKIIITGNTKNL